MHTTTFLAPKTLADQFLALTDLHPEITLDVGEVVPFTSSLYDSHFTYTLWLPEQLHSVVQATAGQALSFAAVDEQVDYVAKTKALFPPLLIGPYFIARNEEPTPTGKIGLSIAPNRAFGSGEHATTTGCLLGYEWLINQGYSYNRCLDFGAGSGLLAIAAAKRQGTQGVCIDNDPPSVEICAENADLNDVNELIVSELGDVPPAQTFPLTFANILLHPLLELAEGLVGTLENSPHAALILSGFTEEQGPELEARYTALGLRKTWQHAQAGWLAQVWQK
jgi:ribosomal protein L11 methyltransferase